MNGGLAVFAGAMDDFRVYNRTLSAAEIVLLAEAPVAGWVKAVVAAGGSVSSGRIALVDALMKGLATDGVLPKMRPALAISAENTRRVR